MTIICDIFVGGAFGRGGGQLGLSTKMEVDRLRGGAEAEGMQIGEG